MRPHYIGADLLSLLEPHEAPAQAAEGWWTCGAAAARVTDGSLELTGTDGVDLVRAACGAAWATVDAGARSIRTPCQSWLSVAAEILS
ncbi:hypothetical protein NKG05_30250 [Oerskovia sp. M15]